MARLSYFLLNQKITSSIFYQQDSDLQELTDIACEDFPESFSFWLGNYGN